MDCKRLWPEGSRARDNFMWFAEELNHIGAKGYRYFVADFSPSGDERYAYTTVLCDDGAGYRNILWQELYASVVEARKECLLEYAIERYFRSPDCPDIKYNYSLF